MKRLINGFIFAFKGLRYAFETQLNFKTHCFATVIAMVLGLALGLNSTEWLWVSAAVAMVMFTELLNTAIEVMVDLVSPSYHPLAGIAKDLSAAAVLIAAFFAAVVGLLIYAPKLWLYVA